MIQQSSEIWEGQIVVSTGSCGKICTWEKGKQLQEITIKEEYMYRENQEKEKTRREENKRIIENGKTGKTTKKR